MQEFRQLEPRRYARMGHEPVENDEIEEIEGSEFARELFDYLNMKPADALASEKPVLQALAVLDSRVGKRTLTNFKSEHAVVERLLGLRKTEWL